MTNDRTEISDVLIRYSSGIDGRDWDLFRSCFTDDVIADYDIMGVIEGLDNLAGVMGPAHEPMVPTYHRISNITINVNGDEPDAHSYVHAVLVTSQDSQDNWVDVVGSYQDKFVRTPDGWKIKHRLSKTARMLTAGEMPSQG